MEPKIESCIKTTNYFIDERHIALNDLSTGAFGPNIGVDGRNLTILFLSLNRAELSIRLLRSIINKLPRFAGDILIADNGSEASELEKIKFFLANYALRCHILELGQNYGVAGGRNRAIEQVKTDWVMSLDNDIFFTSNPLPRIQRDLAILGCHFLNIPLLNPDQQTLFAFGGHLQTLIQNGAPRLTMTTILPPGSPVSSVENVVCGDDAFLCSFLFGGASIFNRHTFARLGRFDENMFIGFEDLDFSLRLFREGIKIGSSSVIALVHDHMKANTDASVKYEQTRYSRMILEKSARYLERKYGFVIWGTETEDWLIRNEKIQGFVQAKQEKIIENLETRLSCRPKVALITDTNNWAFSNISRQIIQNLENHFEFLVIPLVQLSEIEEARWLQGNCQGEFAEGGASALAQALLLAHDCDIIHIFWREFFTLIDTPLFQQYAKSLGMTYADYRHQYIKDKIFSTSVYDHLFLDTDAIEQRQWIYTDVVSGYYVSSNKLNIIYNSIQQYPKPLAVIEDGVDLKLFLPKCLERLDTVSFREIVIGWVGNSKWAATLGDNKGVSTILIPAIEELRAENVPVKLHLCDRQQTYVPHHKMPDYYSEIDIYVCVSLIEGTPNPVLEAMACGVPIISTDVGIVPQAFGPQQKKFILRERTIACLKEAIRKLIIAPKLFRQLSNENLEYVKTWDWKIKTQNFKTYFESLLLHKRVVSGEQRTKICLLPFTTPSMETDGSIRLCSAASIFKYRDETNMGNVREKGLKAIWCGEKYQHIRETLFMGNNLTPYCNSCEYRFDGPAWVLQIHLGLLAYYNDLRSHTIKTLIDVRRNRYEEYAKLAPDFGLVAFPMPEVSQVQQSRNNTDRRIIPFAIDVPEEILEAQNMPINLDVNTINRCNVSCIMCPLAIRYDGLKEEKNKYWRLTLDEYKKLTNGLNIASVHFVGAYAEPLLNKELFSLIAYAHKQGSFTAATSNGMALSLKVAERLIDAKLDMLTISLHGACKETAELVMRKSHFTKIVENIRKLQKIKKEKGVDIPEIYFNYVGMKINIGDLPDFIDLAAYLKVQHIHFIHLIDGDELVDKSQSLSNFPEQLTMFVQEAQKRAKMHNINLYISPAYKEVMDMYMTEKKI